jgi:hypothetical protein
LSTGFFVPDGTRGGGARPQFTLEAFCALDEIDDGALQVFRIEQNEHHVHCAQLQDVLLKGWQL